MIKIIYLTDIHDGLRELKEILIQTEADLYLLSGDIIYKAFFGFDRIVEFCSVQEELDVLAKQDTKDMTPYDFATKVIRFPNKYSETTLSKATLYRSLFQKAAKTMKEKYSLIAQLIQRYCKSKCLCLPGNYDIDLQYTDLHDVDIHRKSYVFKSLKFCGYGGAPIVTSGIPEKLAVKFHEYSKNGVFYSEPEEFFKEELPDITIIHNPAFGYLDRVPGYGNVGSQGIRRFIDEYPPILVVSGHVHEAQGLIKKGKTVFLNPSNFGPVDSIYGFQQGGFFASIEINENTKEITKVELQRMEKFKIKSLLQVEFPNNKPEVTYLNPESPISVEEFLRS